MLHSSTNHGNVTSVFEHPGLMRKDIDLIKGQMQDIQREFEHLHKINRGERNLDQHMDRLTNLIASAENVT